MLSRRSQFSFEENAFAHALRRARAAGRPLLDLTWSNPTEVDLPLETDALRDALGRAAAAPYAPEPFGLETARAAVAQELTSLGTPTRTEQVLLTSSTSEAYTHLLRLFADAGQRVWAPRPCYPLLEHLAQMADVELVRTDLAYDGAWHYPALPSSLTADLRALFLVNPNNPTGNFIDDVALDALSSLGLPLVLDEVFAQFPLHGDVPSPTQALRSRAPLTVSLGGLSKMVGLPQLKLGWMVLHGDAQSCEQARTRLEVMLDAFLSVGSPVQVALADIFALGRKRREAILERCQQNYETLTGAVGGSSVSVLPAQAGWYAILQVPAVTDHDWALALLDGWDVVVQPGWLYDFPRPNHLVVSLLTRSPELKRGIERVIEAAGEPSMSFG
ncbi:MAG: pyridoxal phosphate-dependent aminotransferase [Polyangiaceae bacterium]